jgi:ABC-type molybdate transport system permease subunit
VTPELWGIVWLSLKVGGVAVLASLPVAFALAWLLARGRFPGKLLLDGLVHLPLVVPPVVTGWLLLLAFAPTGPIGGWLESWFGVSVLFRWTGAAIASAVMALPLMVRAMRLSIEAVDRRLEQAAATLGAGRSASSARRSPSSPTCRARRRRCRSPSMPRCRPPAEKHRCCSWPASRCCSRWRPCSAPS